MYKQYKVIVAKYDDDVKREKLKFQKKVEEHLAEGWKCQGGVYSDGDDHFCQAMVK